MLAVPGSPLKGRDPAGLRLGLHCGLSSLDPLARSHWTTSVPSVHLGPQGLPWASRYCSGLQVPARTHYRSPREPGPLAVVGYRRYPFQKPTGSVAVHIGSHPDLPCEAGERGQEAAPTRPQPPSRLVRNLASPDQIFERPPLIYRFGTFSRPNSCGTNSGGTVKTGVSCNFFSVLGTPPLEVSAGTFAPGRRSGSCRHAPPGVLPCRKGLRPGEGSVGRSRHRGRGPSVRPLPHASPALEGWRWQGREVGPARHHWG